MLVVEHLAVKFHHNNDKGIFAVKDFNLRMNQGEIVGIVGESGSGKSVTVNAIMGLLERSKADISGTALFEGMNLLTMDRMKLRHYQGDELSIIFQEPMTSLNPTMKVGAQVEESLRTHTKLDREERRKRAFGAMIKAGLHEPQKLYDRYPHELSGGMRQRVMIASAIVLNPKLLIADEPTTALDVTIQAKILHTLREINSSEGTAILFISHDLGVIHSLCQRVLVMQKGLVVEEGQSDEVFYHPKAEYTRRLIAARPGKKKLKPREYAEK